MSAQSLFISTSTSLLILLFPASIPFDVCPTQPASLKPFVCTTRPSPSMYVQHGSPWMYAHQAPSYRRRRIPSSPAVDRGDARRFFFCSALFVYRPMVVVLSFCQFVVCHFVTMSCLHPVAVVLPLVRLLTTSPSPRPTPPLNPVPPNCIPVPHSTPTFAYALFRLQRPLEYLVKCPSSNFGHSVLCPFSALPTNPRAGLTGDRARVPVPH